MFLTCGLFVFFSTTLNLNLQCPNLFCGYHGVVSLHDPRRIPHYWPGQGLIPHHQQGCPAHPTLHGHHVRPQEVQINLDRNLAPYIITFLKRLEGSGKSFHCRNWTECNKTWTIIGFIDTLEGEEGTSSSCQDTKCQLVKITTGTRQKALPQEWKRKIR